MNAYNTVVYVVIDNGDQQRRGLYVDGGLVVAGSAVLTSRSLVGIISGPSAEDYEEVYIGGESADSFCRDYADFPATLDTITDSSLTMRRSKVTAFGELD